MNHIIPDVGQGVPDFDVLNSEGNIVKISEELKKGTNIKLMFYRGHW